MKNFLRTLKSEFRRILSDRKLLICTLAILAGFLVVISVFLATNSLGGMSTHRPEVEYCQSEFEHYQECYLYLSGQTQEKPFWLGKWITLDIAKERMEYYSFMVKHGGEIRKYIDLVSYHEDHSYYSIPTSSLGAYAMLWIMNIVSYALIFVAILISALICLAPYTNGVMKNYYASPVKKSTLFAGKLTACWVVCLLCWLVVLVWGLCFGTVGEPIGILHFDGDKYTSYALSGVFVTKMLGTLIAMLVVSALTAFIGRLTGKNFLPAAGVVLFCTFFGLLYELRGASGITTTLKKTLLPIMGLRATPYLAADSGLWWLYAFYIIVSAALFAASVFISRKTKYEN